MNRRKNTILIIYLATLIYLKGEIPSGNIKLSNRITNSDLSKNGSWPWLAAMKVGKPGNSYFTCTAALISYDKIITAAHCVKNLSLEQVYFSIGSNYKYSDSIILNPSEIIPHPEFSRKTGYHDIAVIKLKQNVTFSNYTKSIYLPKCNRFDLVFNKTVTVVGWGKIAPNTSADFLYESNFVIKNNQSNPDCMNRDLVNYCAIGSNQSTICSGDSGGPLMYNLKGTWYLYGISSWAYCGKNSASFFTIVPHYLEWINKI